MLQTVKGCSEKIASRFGQVWFISCPDCFWVSCSAGCGPAVGESSRAFGIEAADCLSGSQALAASSVWIRRERGYGGIPLATFPISNLVKVHLGGILPYPWFIRLSLLVGFPDLLAKGKSLAVLSDLASARQIPSRQRELLFCPEKRRAYTVFVRLERGPSKNFAGCQLPSLQRCRCSVTFPGKKLARHFCRHKQHSHPNPNSHCKGGIWHQGGRAAPGHSTARHLAMEPNSVHNVSQSHSLWHRTGKNEPCPPLAPRSDPKTPSLSMFSIIQASRVPSHPRKNCPTAFVMKNRSGFNYAASPEATFPDFQSQECAYPPITPALR